MCCTRKSGRRCVHSLLGAVVTGRCFCFGLRLWLHFGMRSITRLCEFFLSDFPKPMEKDAGKRPMLALGGSAAEEAFLISAAEAAAEEPCTCCRRRF